MPPPPTTTKHWFIAWFINISFRCMHLHLSYFIGYKSGDKMIYRSVLIYYHKKKNINCSKANVIHLFRGSLKNTTQNENKINIKRRHWFFFSLFRSVVTSQDEVFCCRSDSLFSSAYVLSIFWRPCLCCITQRVCITK